MKGSLPALVAVATAGLLALGRHHPLALAGAAPPVAMATALLATCLPGHPWRGATPTLTWLVVGCARAARTALLGPWTAGLLATLPALLLTLPPAALPGAVLYLVAAIALGTGLTLQARTAAAALTRVATALALLYAVPLYLLAVAELLPRPERVIAALLPVWPPAVAAALTGVDLARLPWAYAHLPLAYYRYHYPSPWLAAALLALPALTLHLTLWRRPRRGWRRSIWSNAMRRLALPALLLTLPALLLTPVAQAQEPGKPMGIHEATKRGVDRALRWLRHDQGKDGSWSGHPGITSLVTLAYLRSPRHYREGDGPFIDRAIAYLTSKAHPNGAIYDRDNPGYNTALAIQVLAETKNPAYRPLIDKAAAYLRGIQAREANGYPKSHKYYGGIGYGGDERPDLSNLQFAVEALRAADVDPKDPAWGRAIQFISRCQNRSESNDQPWAANDGGFVYAPGESFAGATRSYGSMTFAGIKSLIFARVGRDDPRVKAGVEWARHHYSVEENPGLGQQGYYYYVDTFARTLALLGDPTLKTADGVDHRWAEELAHRLLSLQNEDGWWSNPVGRWWEGNKHLATAHACLALAACYPFLSDETR